VNRRKLNQLSEKLFKFLEEMTEGLGRPERRKAMREYVQGLLLNGERKSIQPMALRLAASENDAEAMRQRLQQCVAVAVWDPNILFGRLVRHAQKNSTHSPPL
jgi:SRSO17 transposase